MSSQRFEKTYSIIEYLDEKDPPRPHERYATKIITQYFKSDIRFMRKTINSSPDIEVLKLHETREIKSPKKLLTFYEPLFTI